MESNLKKITELEMCCNYVTNLVLELGPLDVVSLSILLPSKSRPADSEVSPLVRVVVVEGGAEPKTWTDIIRNNVS